MKQSFVTPKRGDPGRTANDADLPDSPRIWIGFVIAATVFAAEIAKDPLGIPVLAIGLIGLSGWIYWLSCVFRFHSIITTRLHEYPIGPAWALFGHFVPFFNFYWVIRWPTVMSNQIRSHTAIRMVPGGLLGLVLLAAPFVSRGVDNAVGLAMVFAVGGYLDAKLHEFVRAAEAPSLGTSTRRTCPNCEAAYDPSDYRADADHIYCSACKAELPRDSEPVTL